MRHTLVILVLVAVVCLSGCKAKETAAELSGSGSSFVWPIMSRWVPEYERAEQGAKVVYRPKGSSEGIKDLLDKKVDFACSDGPLDDEQMNNLKKQGNEVVHIPLILSAVVAVYNLDEVKEPIRFTGAVLADIYLGAIKKWDDPALKTLNPMLQLPDKEIHVVHRSDGSGTTFIWTDYLSKCSGEWQKRIGSHREVKWPLGIGGNGNEGVAEKVKETPSSIGYIDLADAYRKSLAFGLVQNREKEFVRASLDSVLRAAENSTKSIPSDLRYSLTDAAEKGAYPITGTTWAIVYLDQSKNPRGRSLVSFLKWVVGDGQLFAEQLLYAKMPTGLAEKSLLTIERIKLGT